MDVIYVDTSVLVSIFFEGNNPINRGFIEKLNTADEVVSCSLLEAEFLSVLKREKISFEGAKALLGQISLVFPDRSLFLELNKVLTTSYVRGADALHLACALYLDPGAAELIFLSYDKQQSSVAHQLGFRLS
jgi:predicted nucleic acid-binding protein